MSVRGDIRDFVMHAFYAPLRLRDEASLLGEKIIDPTGVLELVAYVEESYAIEVDAQEMGPENFGSIAAIAEYVERKLGEADAGPRSGRRVLSSAAPPASGQVAAR